MKFTIEGSDDFAEDFIWELERMDTDRYVFGWEQVRELFESLVWDSVKAEDGFSIRHYSAEEEHQIALTFKDFREAFEEISQISEPILTVKQYQIDKFSVDRRAES